MPEIKKLKKKLAKLERKYDTASPIQRMRIEKSAVATEKRLAHLQD